MLLYFVVVVVVAFIVVVKSHTCFVKQRHILHILTHMSCCARVYVGWRRDDGRGMRGYQAAQISGRRF